MHAIVKPQEQLISMQSQHYARKYRLWQPFLLVYLLLLLGKAHAMNHNLALPWSDGCSSPQTPYLAFYSPQSAEMLFTSGDSIEIICQAGLRAVGLRWSLHRNTLKLPFREGTAEALSGNRYRLRIDTAGLYPGFYDLRVELDTGLVNPDKQALLRRPVRGICTVGWKAEAMALPETRPADFSPFWSAAKAKLAAMPLEAHEGPLQTFGAQEINAYNVASACLPPDYDPQGHRAETVESGKVDFAGPDGGRVYGWLAKPVGKGPFPAMLVLPGAGFNARPRPLEHARHGYVALDIQVHGQEVDLPTYEQLAGPRGGGTDPALNSFYQVHLRCLQAINYLASRPDVDPTRIVVAGGSQGGRLSIVMAALDPRIAAAVAAIPHAANHPFLRWASRCNGFSELGNMTPDPNIPLDNGMQVTGVPPLRDDAITRCQAYYDPINFAPDVRCPIFMDGGLIDPTSPPTGVWALYARLGSPRKTLLPLDGLGHDWSAEFDRRAWRWLEDVLRKAP